MYAQAGLPKKKSFAIENIELLKSTKADVENILGTPFLENVWVSVYGSARGKVMVVYVGDSSYFDESCRWDAPPDTVLSYRISIGELTPLSATSLDLRMFDRKEGPNDDAHYITKEKDVEFTTLVTDKGEFLKSITFNPAISARKQRCPGLKKSL
jgi:hypothetical protein